MYVSFIGPQFLQLKIWAFIVCSVPHFCDYKGIGRWRKLVCGPKDHRRDIGNHCLGWNWHLMSLFPLDFFFSWILCWVNFIFFSCGLLVHAYWTFKLYFPLLWTWGALWNGVPAPSEQGNQLRQVWFTAHTASKMQNQDKDSVIFFPCWFLGEYLKLACLCRNQQP